MNDYHANLLLMRQVSESLAGRASYLTLWPMTRREQRGLGQCGRWEELLATADTEWRDLLAQGKDLDEDWRALAVRGGFPTPALQFTTAADRRIWFDSYVRTYLERDLQDLARSMTSTISGAPLLPLKPHAQRGAPGDRHTVLVDRHEPPLTHRIERGSVEYATRTRVTHSEILRHACR